jgi:hypothetical protein
MPCARCLALGVFAIPGLALATAREVLDLRAGAVAELTAKTLALAHGLLAFLFVLGLTLELLRGPGERKRYLAVVWRTLLVLGLLQAYTFLAGSVVKQCTTLADTLAIKDSAASPLDEYQAAVAPSAPGSPQRVPAGSQGVMDEQAGGPSGLGGLFFSAAVDLVLLIALAISWAFSELSRILIAFFYVIGPLALAFHVLRLEAPGRWFRSLVTVCCWPVVSSVLLHLSSSALAGATLPTTSIGATFKEVASSLLLCVLALATPKIAAGLVGGVGNLLGEGASAAMSVASGAAAVGVLR